jgi:hypothetical protein
VVVFLLYCFFVLFPGIDWEWDNALGLPAIAAGIAGAISFLRSDGYEVEATSYADAATLAAHRNDRRRQASRRQPPRQYTLGRRHDDEPVYDDDSARRSGTSATARSHASTR